MKRYSIKFAGQSGQGIETVGRILARSLKRAGFHVMAYREYASLIKGGNATYKIEFADYPIYGVSKKSDVVVVLNRLLTKWFADELPENGLVLHGFDSPIIPQEDFELMKQKNVRLGYIPAAEIIQKAGGTEVMINTVFIGVIWRIMNLNLGVLGKTLFEVFAKKPEAAEANLKVIRTASEFKFDHEKQKCNENLMPLCDFDFESLLKYFELHPNPDYADDLLVSGNEAVALGAINAGVRAFFGYPMTPTSNLLTYMAAHSHEFGIIVKQVEDEITASAMTIGAGYAGTRAFTATSGGGFDLMTEHVSLAGMSETPFVVVVGQRPGPATGLPTWTSQGDLNLAIFSGHGESPKLVIALSNSEDSFYLMQHAFNYAEKFQLPVIVLTEKVVGESLFMAKPYDEAKVPIERGISSNIALKTQRYKLTDNGISERWLPIKENATYLQNSDEHNAISDSTEEAEDTRLQVEKRLRKMKSLYDSLPDPEVFENNPASVSNEISIIGWGSTKNVILDVLKELELKNIKARYLHFSYMWPLRIEKLEQYLSNKNLLIIENNSTAQFKSLIKMQTGKEIPNTFLKYNGRPFYVEEVMDFIDKLLNTKQ